jgi:RNA polymerase sigma-70 factor (ECF subfamily)
MSVEEEAFGAYKGDPTRDRLLALLRTQQDRVYNVCYQVLRHAQDAEDAAQKVLLKLVEGIGGLPDAVALRRWLHRVCLTTSLDARTERSRRRAREREVALKKQTDSTPEPDGEGDLMGAIGSLDADLGDLILRHYFEKTTLKELAAERQVSEVAVWKRIEKGKGKLRELLSTSGAAMSMAALDLRLASIVPVQAPVAWTGVVLAAKASVALGGLAVAAKGVSTAKIVAACIGLLAVGLAAGIAIGSSRARREAPEVQQPQVVAVAKPTVEKGGAPSGESASASAPAPAAAVSVRQVPAEASPDDGLRELLRKMARMAIKARGSGKLDASSDPEALPVMTKIMTELGPTLQAPASDPPRYSKIVKLSLDVMFEELGCPLTEAQKSSIGAGVDRMKAQLEQCRNESAQDRNIGELRAYRELNAGLKALTDVQIGKMTEVTSPSTMFPLGGTTTVLLNTIEDPAEQIAREWIKGYQLVDSQNQAAASAARTYVETLDQVDRRFEAQYGHRPGEKPAGSSLNSFVDQTAAVVDYAIATAEAQRDALRLLEGAMTPEQLEKLRGTTMTEFKRGAVKVVRVGADR